jgi:hypothetical protein
LFALFQLKLAQPIIIIIGVSTMFMVTLFIKRIDRLIIK